MKIVGIPVDVTEQENICPKRHCKLNNLINFLLSNINLVSEQDNCASSLTVG